MRRTAPGLVLLALACGGTDGEGGAELPARDAARPGAEGEPSPDAAVPLIMSQGRITTDDGVGLFYRSVGVGPQAVVVPQGFYLVEALLPLRSADRRLIFYDPRGRGRSEAGDRSAVTLDRQIADLEALRRELRLDSMAIIGWSGMGMETAVYAMRHPERVTRLIQVAPVAARNRPHNPAAYAERRRRTDPEALEAVQARRAAGELTTPADHCRALNRVTLPASFADPAHMAEVPDVCRYPNELPDSLAPLFDALLDSFGDYDWRDKLDRLDMPRLVIHGADDAFPVEGSREWVAGQPHARLLVLEDAGHFPFLERPDAFFSAVETFLEGGWPEDAERVPTPLVQPSRSP